MNPVKIPSPNPTMMAIIQMVHHWDMDKREASEILDITQSDVELLMSMYPKVIDPRIKNRKSKW